MDILKLFQIVPQFGILENDLTIMNLFIVSGWYYKTNYNSGYKIKRGLMQDVTFITADPVHTKADKPRGDEVRTRRSKEGTWIKKGNNPYFGFKTHTLVDKDSRFI
ncbi:hypothetical protein [Methanospirillum lacunae]|uniref:hypothetical protein n=1 Tax=Methanospirillum lacunae TaxID=668570 RepID=UPI0038FC80A3